MRQKTFQIMISVATATLTAAAFLPATAAAQQGARELGLWYDDTGKGAVEILTCGERLCGKIVWLKEPLNSKGEPKHDAYNPNPDLKQRPICGLQILGNLQKMSDGAYDGGWVYDPKVGKQYNAAIQLTSKDQLTLTGYLGARFLGKSFVWNRAPADLPRCGAGSASKNAPAAPASASAVKPKPGTPTPAKLPATATPPSPAQKPAAAAAQLPAPSSAPAKADPADKARAQPAASKAAAATPEPARPVKKPEAPATVKAAVPAGSAKPASQEAAKPSGPAAQGKPGAPSASKAAATAPATPAKTPAAAPGSATAPSQAAAAPKKTAPPPVTANSAAASAPPAQGFLPVKPRPSEPSDAGMPAFSYSGPQ